MKICKCGKEFEPKAHNQIYCSIECPKMPINTKKVLIRMRADPEKYKIRSHINYLKHKETYLKSARRWEKENPEKKKTICKKSFQKFMKNNPTWMKEYMKKYYQEHKEELKAYQRERHNEKK